MFGDVSANESNDNTSAGNTIFFYKCHHLCFCLFSIICLLVLLMDKVPLLIPFDFAFFRIS